MPPRGPRSVLCVVVVTMGACGNGCGCAPAATSPRCARCPRPASRRPRFAISAKPAKSQTRGYAVPPQRMSLGRASRASASTRFRSTRCVSRSTSYCTAWYCSPEKFTFQPCVRWPPKGRPRPMTVSPGFTQREIDGLVRRRARVGLHVRVGRAEQRLGALDRERLDAVDVLLTLVVAPPRITFRILVRENRARGLHDGAESVVLGRNQANRFVLPAGLFEDQRMDFRIRGGQSGHIRHEFSLAVVHRPARRRRTDGGCVRGAPF